MDEYDKLVRNIRDTYVGIFAKAVKTQLRGRDVGSVLVEPFMNDETTEVPRTCSADPFQVPLRPDIVPMAGGKPEAYMVVRGPEPEFEQVALEYEDGFQVGIGPFTWDECRVVAVNVPEYADLSPLVEWFQEWADTRDEREPDKKTGLRGVVHHIELTGREGEVIGFEADLGTAPVDALEELLGTLKEMGATHILLGAFEQGDDENDEGGDADDSA